MGRPLSENASACRGAFPDLLEQAKEAGVLTILRRILRYGDKVVHLTALLCQMIDRRKRPRIPTRLIAGSVLVMLLCRLGSLHALEKAKSSSFWRHWLRAPLPSADSTCLRQAGRSRLYLDGSGQGSRGDPSDLHPVKAQQGDCVLVAVPHSPCRGRS